MNPSCGIYRLYSRVTALLITVALVCAVPLQAYADVRLSDSIVGESVEARGLSVSKCPSINAEYAFVTDLEGNVYFERNAEAETKIASITKIMTAIVAIEQSSPEDQIVVSQAAADIGESTASLQEGDILTMDQALLAMMVPSGNDAALAIAETLGKKWANSGEDSVTAYVRKMNEKAAELGMTNTLFENPHGLDNGDYAGELHSTAHDVGIMCSYAMKLDSFRPLVDKPSVSIFVTREGEKAEIELESTDEILESYEGTCGIKTGFTRLAGYSFAGACERNGKTVIAVVINANDSHQRFNDCVNLFDWVYGHQKDYKLINSPETATMMKNGQEVSVPVVAYVSHGGWMDKTIKATVEDPNQTVSIFDLHGNVSQEVSFRKITEDIHVGDKLGTITFMQHNEVVATINIISCENVNAPNVIEGMGIWVDRLFVGFDQEKCAAHSVLINTTPLLVDRSTM